MSSIYTLTLNFNDAEGMQYALEELLPPRATGGAQLDAMTLEELLLYVDERVQREGYEMEIRKRGVLTALDNVAPKAEPEGVPEEVTLAAKVTPKAKPISPKSAKLKAELTAALEERDKGNGAAAPETDDQRKQRCVDKLQELFYAGHKDQVRALLKQYGDGAKSFQAVSVERFAEIDQALQELGL